LPPLAIRIASVVPDGATDIREAGVPSLAEIEQVAFRATILRVLAGLLFVFGALTLALAFVRGVRRQRAASPEAARGLSDRVILQGVRRELTTVQEQAGESGWTTDLAARALSAARIAATCAAGRPIAQKPARADVAIDGQLFVRDTFRLGRITPTALVSGAVTAEGLTRALAAGPSKNGDNAAHSELHAALAHFTTVCYGRASVPAPATRAGGERAGTNAQREPRLDASAMTSPAGDTSDPRASSADGANPAALNTATEQALRAVDALAAERTWTGESRRAWTRALAGAKERVWGR
jgi:hypothetical protein